MTYKRSEFLILYTVKLRKRNPSNPNRNKEIIIKHCLKSDSTGGILRPLRYPNELNERHPVENIDTETGWEWDPISEDEYEIVSTKREWSREKITPFNEKEE